MLPVLHNNGLLTPPRLEGPANRLSSLFNQFFNDDFFAPLAAAAPATSIPLSLWEDEDHFCVEVDVPGMAQEDIDISIQNGDLLIRGQRKCERQGNGYDTRCYGRFEQRISLPTWAKADRVEAKLNKGVLSLTFPKGEDAKPKKITVQGS